MASSVTVKRKRLGEIQGEVGNAIVIALVLSKTQPNIFLSKDTNEFRGVITYTLRDSRQHIINCKCWGSKENIDDYHRQLKIGDIIIVIGAKVMTSENNDMPFQNCSFERCQPKPTLPYTLVINEGSGRLEKYGYNDGEVLVNRLGLLLHLSHKPQNTVLNLADVQCYSSKEHQMESHFVDLMVVVVALRPVKTVKSTRQFNQLLHCLELVVCDKSWPDGLLLAIWNSDWIQRAEQYWTPGKTVLHLIDVRVSYSDFYKCATLSSAACTLIYENPLGEEAKALLAFATNAPAKNIDPFVQAGVMNLPPVDQIRTQMTVKQIYEHVNTKLEGAGGAEEFTAVLIAMVTKFNIDGPTSHVVGKKCKSCRRLLPRNSVECANMQCQLEISLNCSGSCYETFFNCNIQFSDHTGTLLESSLSNEVAERLLGMQVDAFLLCSDAQKAKLKWRYLMNHFEVKLYIKKPNEVRRSLMIAVVDMRQINIDELAQKMVVFW